ncbi:MAG: DUF1236 domain-containing protein [Xanthobacteraceae bacterium]
MKKGATPKAAQQSQSQSGDQKPGAGDAKKSSQRGDRDGSQRSSQQGERSGRNEMQKGAQQGDRSGSKAKNAEKSTTGAGSSGSLSGDQRTRVKQTFSKHRGGARVTNVNFNVSVGTRVPGSVTLVAVPSDVIAIYPAWRGYRYFETEDEIVIVDPNTMEIIAVIDA